MATKQNQIKRRAVKPRPAGWYLDFDDDCTSYEAFGLYAGDQVSLTPFDDPRPGETLFVHSGGRWHVGRFVGFAVEADGVRVMHVEEPDGLHRYTGDPIPCYRLETITRKVERSAPDAKVSAGPTPADLRRIAELRERLDGLYEPEQERAYFKTLREIWDLEHPQEFAAWPDVIAA